MALTTENTKVSNIQNLATVMHASLSGHSQQTSPSVMWPQSFGTAIINAFTSPSHQRPPL